MPNDTPETLDDLTFLFDHLRKYFSARIIRTAPLDKDAVYMFGYHPHGIVPLTLLWFTLTSAWKELFPGLTVNPCSARHVMRGPGSFYLRIMYFFLSHYVYFCGDCL